MLQLDYIMIVGPVNYNGRQAARLSTIIVYFERSIGPLLFLVLSYQLCNGTAKQKLGIELCKGFHFSW